MRLAWEVKSEADSLHLLLPPWMVWAWEEAVPSSTMGSRRARAVRSWQGMRQKALAEPDSIAAAAMDATDFMVESVVGLG
ncbi:hypothetical protein IG631_03943 [Alternaria alternata]|nr:hypothetical protein IG631_03943 [Alternaria alternata]